MNRSVYYAKNLDILLIVTRTGKKTNVTTMKLNSIFDIVVTLSDEVIIDSGGSGSYFLSLWYLRKTDWLFIGYL